MSRDIKLATYAETDAAKLIHDKTVAEITAKIREAVGAEAFPVETALTIAASIGAAIVCDAIRAGHPPSTFHAFCDDVASLVREAIQSGGVVPPVKGGAS